MPNRTAMVPTDSALAPCVCGLPVDVRAPRFLLECHYCGRWCHGDCERVAERDALQIAKFACAACVKRGHATERYQYSDSAPAFDVDELSFAPLPIQRRSAEHATASAVAPPATYRKNTEAFRRVLKTAIYARSGVHSALAHDVNAGYFKLHALDQPLLVLSGGEGGSAPLLPAIAVRDVAQLLDSPTGIPISSVDVESQAAFALTSRAWSDKLRASFDAATSSTSASSPLNAVFRLRGTPFAHRVAAPEAVTTIDWRSTLSTAAYQQRREADAVGCFLGANAFLDFQIAPGGRSSWLSVSHGELWAFLIPPTPAHLRAFQQWKCSPPSSRSSSPSNASPPPSRVFLAELVDKCIKCVVPAGASLVLPAGYAVALFAAQGDDCSFFSSLFSATSTLDRQLQVVLDLELPSRQQQQSSSGMASIWSITMDASDTSSQAVDAQVWAAVTSYSRQLVSTNSVSDQDKLALRRALPLLRRWSATASTTLPRTADWAPTSTSEGLDAISRLEQALSVSASASASAPQFGLGSPHYGNTLMPHVSSGLSPMNSGAVNTSAAMQLPSLSPSEANYLYSAAGAADDWPLPDSGSNANGMMGMNMGMGGMEGFASSHSFPSAMHSMWGEYQHQEQFGMAPEHGGNALGMGPDASQFFPSAGGYHHASSLPSSAPTGASSSGIFTPLGSNTPYMTPMGSAPSGSSGNYFSESMGRPGSVSSSVSAAAMALGIGSRPPLGASDPLVRHRASCHRCGNLRKKNVRCPSCPHIFCQKCAEKMVEEHGDAIFSGGCPVCKERCCCGKNRSVSCTHKYHCYKKCPSTKRPAA